MTVPSQVLRFWRALDARLASVVPTRWGAVVTDARFPAIWDANYARVDADAERLSAREIEGDLLPALRAAGAEVQHVVAFDPDAARQPLAELSSRGHRLTWDAVMMRLDDPPDDGPTVQVEAVELDVDGWRDIRASLAGPFGIEEGDPLEQLMRLEREVLAPAGKRWFGVRVDGRWVSLAALLVLSGVAYVDNVATDEAFRGRGLASAITRRIVREASAEGITTTFLLADPDEAATIRLYERLGFRRVGTIASTRGPLR